MKLQFEIFCLGYKIPGSPRMLWGAILVAYAPDGREKKMAKVGILDDGITKNLADIVATMKALQCIQPDQRVSEVTLYAPAGYALQMLEREPDGSWSSIPQSNIDEIAALRSITRQYSKLEIRKGDRNIKLFRETTELLQKQVADAGMAPSQRIDNAAGNRTAART